MDALSMENSGPDRAVRGYVNNVCLKENKMQLIYLNAYHKLRMFQEWLETLYT